jgi:glycosyltransferase involved in cell wall biosynthesis
MKALVALHDELLNGATISVLRAVPLLEDRGWEFAFWVPQPGPAAERLAADGATIAGEWRPVVSGLRPLREPPGIARRLAATPGYLRRFRRFVHEAGPDLVHANSLFSYAEALSAHRSGVPTMLHLHDMAPASRKRAVARAICRRLDLTIAASKACASSYAGGDWSPQVVHEAAPVPPEPVPLRDSPRPFVVGTVGVIAPRKGSDVFVEAARAVLATGEEIEFRMVGRPTDPLEREWGEGVLERARALGIGHQPEADILDEFRRWDAFVLPSRADPFPIVMLEAMAAGLPVIGTRVDGLAEQITPQSGVLVAPEEPGELAGAIVSLARRPLAEREAMGTAARERVAANFTIERQAEGLDRAYRETIARSARD